MFQSPMEIKRNLNQSYHPVQKYLELLVSISYGDKEKFERYQSNI